MPKKKRDLVTVIVLHYQEYQLTKECVDSILESTYPMYDILIIDNGSTNNSFEKLNKTYSQNKKITIKRSTKNLQFAGGFNYGAKHAKGKYIILLSNDIIVDPHWIDELVKYADEKVLIQPRIMRYYEKKRIDNVGGNYNAFGMGIGISHRKDDDNATAGVDFVSATTLMISRTFFLKLGGYDPWFRSHYEDVDLSLRAKNKGGTCLVSYDSVIYHKGSQTYKKYANSNNTLMDVRKNRVQTIVKNFNGYEKFVRLTLCLIALFPFGLRDLFRLDKDVFLTYRAILLGLNRTNMLYANPFKTYRSLILKTHLNKTADMLYVIPIHNLKDDLYKTLKSIKKQRNIKSDILLVDNKNNDLTNIISEFPSINYISLKKPTGSAGGFRIGGEVGIYYEYDYIIFGDDEATLMNAFSLQRMKDVLDKDTACGAVGPVVYGSDETKYSDPIPVRGLGSFCMVVKKTALLKAGLHNMDLFWLGDDVELSLGIARYFKEYLVPGAVYFHPWYKPGRQENVSIYFILRNLLYLALRSPKLGMMDHIHVLYYYMMKLAATIFSSIVFTDLTYLHTIVLAFLGTFDLKKPLHKQLLKNNYHMIPLNKKPKGKSILLGSLSIFKKSEFYYTYLQPNKKQYYQLIQK